VAVWSGTVADGRSGDLPGGVDGSVGITVGEFVLLGRQVHRGDLQGFTNDDRTIAEQALERVQLSGLAHRALHELSGGERQRVMIARCLAQQTP
jgi:iron complex transport system ATP-binding protein